MAKLSLTDIASGYNSYSTYNANNTLIEAALENTLSLDGTSPNAMQANLDMNSYRILNLPTAVNNSEPVTLGQANTLAGVTNPLTQDSVSAVLWPQTAAETSAGVTVVNYQYEPGNVLRYGTNTNPGTTDMSTAIQAAIDVAYTAGGGDVLIPAGTYACNITVKDRVSVRGEGRGSILSPFTDTAAIITINASESTSFWSICDLSIVGTDDAAKTGQHGIVSSPVGVGVTHAYFEIANLRIDDCGGCGIYINSTALAGPLTQLFTLRNVRVRDSHQQSFLIKGTTVDFTMVNCNGQMINTDTAGTYPVCELNGGATSLVNANLISCWFNKSGSSDVPTTGTGLHIEDCQNLTAIGCSVEDANPFLHFAGSLNQHLEFINLRCNTANNITNMVELNRARYLSFRNSKFLCTGTCTTGIKQTSGTAALTRLVKLDEMCEIDGATTPMDMRRNLTINAGKAYYYEDMLQLDTEAAAGTDDLDYLYGAKGNDSIADIPPGAVCRISPAADTRDIVIKHGTGNIYLNGAADVTLNTLTDSVVLQFDEKLGYWTEIGRCLV